MSIHPSLSSAAKGKKQRTVLKRIERIKHLMKKDLWADGSNVYGLPKIKIARLKVKKEKAAEKPAEGAEGAVATETKATPAAGEQTKQKEKTKKE